MVLNIFKNTALYTIGNIIPKAASFILLPIYTIYLSTADFGIIQSVLSLTPIFLIIFSFSMGASVFRLYFDYKTEDEKKTFFSTIFLFSLFVSTIFLILLLILGGFIEKIYSSIPFYPYFIFVIITSYITNFFDLPQKYLMIEDKPIQYVLLSLLRFSMNACLILFFITNKNEGATGYLKAGVFSSLILLPIYLSISFRMINFRFSFSILKKTLVYSLPLVPTLLSAWVLDLSDRIFLERYFSLEEVGIYSLSYKIAGIVLIVVTSFNMAYRPLFFKLANLSDQDHGKSLIFKYNYLFILIFLLLVFIVSFLSKEIVFLLFNENYYAAYLYIPIIALSYVFSVAGGLVNRFFEQSKFMVVNMTIHIIIAMLNLILNYLLIPIFGAYGAAVSTVISLLVGFIASYLYSRKYCFFVPFDWVRIIKDVSFLSFVYFVFNFFFYFENIYLSLIIKILIGCIVAVLMLKRHVQSYKTILQK